VVILNDLEKVFSIHESFAEDLLVAFSCCCLGYYVHVVAEDLAVMLADVGQRILSGIDLSIPYVWVISLDIEVSDVGESERLSVPGAYMEVEVTVLMGLLANGCFEKVSLCLEEVHGCLP
jgi:hypothetical protein